MQKSGLFDLSGKVALVTAGGSGLGRAYCEAMSEFGAQVACNDIDPTTAEETVNILSAFGQKAIAVPADVSDPRQVERMVGKTLEEFGTIDVLFCNAGIPAPLVPFHELSLEDWDRTIATNLTSVFLCIKAVLPTMLSRGKGSIISTSSLAGVMARISGDFCTPTYGATKAGIIGLTKHLAVEYAKQGIRVNAIAPGLHLSDRKLTKTNVNMERFQQVRKLIMAGVPMGRGADPSEIKGLAVWLASDASGYVTGQVFVQDGGVNA